MAGPSRELLHASRARLSDLLFATGLGWNISERITLGLEVYEEYLLCGPKSGNRTYFGLFGAPGIARCLKHLYLRGFLPPAPTKHNYLNNTSNAATWRYKQLLFLVHSGLEWPHMQLFSPRMASHAALQLSQ